MNPSPVPHRKQQKTLLKFAKALLSLVLACSVLGLQAEPNKPLEIIPSHASSINGMVIVNAYEQQTHASNFEQALNSSIGIVVQSDRMASYIVTHASLVAGAGRLSIDVTAADGTRKVMPAQILALRPALDYALLKVKQFQHPTIVFAIETPATKATVWAAHLLNLPGQRATTTAVSFARGMLSNAILMTAKGMEIVNHSAGLDLAGESMLFNDCGELVGFNLSSSIEWRNQRAISAASLANLVATENISIHFAELGCESDVERARLELKHAHSEANIANRDAALAIARADELSQALTSSSDSGDDLVAALEQAKLKAEKATEVARMASLDAEKNRVVFEQASARLRRETAAELAKLKAEQSLVRQKFDRALASQQKTLDSQTLWFWLLLICLIVVLVVFFINRLKLSRVSGKRRGEIEEARDASSIDVSSAEDTQKAKREEDDSRTVLATAGVTEYVFDGKDELGLRYLLRIQQGQLMTAQGVVLGRNPGSIYTLSHGDVSRKHCGLHLVERRLFIEDLDSTNGTRVNGQEIKDKGRIMLNDGDQVALGSVVMELAIIKI